MISSTVRLVLLIPMLALAAASVVFTGCSPHSPVRVQPAAGTDFGKYHTYAIKPGNVVFPGASEAERAEMERLVQDAVAANLESRGLAPQPDEPELVVTYTMGARSRDGLPGGAARPAVGIDAQASGGNPYDEPGALRAGEFPGAAADADFRALNVDGNLVIDLLDGRSRRLVWRATADVDLSPGRRSRAIGSMVHHAFAELPALRASGTPASMPATQPVPETRPTAP